MCKLVPTQRQMKKKITTLFALDFLFETLDLELKPLKPTHTLFYGCYKGEERLKSKVLKHFDKCWGKNKIPGLLHKPPLEKQLQQRGISFCLLWRLWHVMNRFSLPLICQTYYKAMSFVGAESREEKEATICLPRFLVCWSEMRDFLSKINISFHLIPNQQRSGELQVYTGYERCK